MAQLTALGEVSRAVSSTLDLDTVLEHDRHPREAARGDRRLHDLRVRSKPRRLPAPREPRSPTPTRRPSWTRSRAPRHPQGSRAGRPSSPDCASRSTSLTSRWRASTKVPCGAPLLAGGLPRPPGGVPLLREEQVIGVLAVLRKTPGDFAPRWCACSMTFATPVGPRDRERTALPARSRTRAGSSRPPAATSRSSWPTCPTSSGRR